MNNKSGITMVTIVMYVVIFFALTALATGVTIAMESNSLKDKGKIFVSEAEIKLKSNISSSLENSDSFEIINGKLVFSNNDVYHYDEQSKIIYKNYGILIQNVNSMQFSIDNIVEGHVYKININAVIEKYNTKHDVQMSFVKSEV